MRPKPFVSLALPVAALLAVAGPAAAAPATDAAYHVVHPHRAIAAGEHLELRLEPTPPPGTRVIWSVGPGTPGSVLYRAPFLVAPGAPPVTVIVTLSGPGLRTSASARIELAPGELPGAAGCLGPGQSFSTTSGTILPEYTVADVLPEVLTRVDPEVPASARARGLADTIPVSALVCRDGRVLDVYVLVAYRDTRDAPPIAYEPSLVEAALAAVRQWVFRPARAAGQPIAVWVTVPVAVGP